METLHPFVIEYKGKLYSFSSFDDAPFKIEAILQAVDEGRVPSLPDMEDTHV